MTNTQYVVCATCAYGIQYADTSGMDDEAAENFETFCESVGYLCPIGSADRKGNWDCPGCGEIVYESGHIFENLFQNL